METGICDVDAVDELAELGVDAGGRGFDDVEGCGLQGLGELAQALFSCGVVGGALLGFGVLLFDGGKLTVEGGDALGVGFRVQAAKFQGVEQAFFALLQVFDGAFDGVCIGGVLGEGDVFQAVEVCDDLGAELFQGGAVFDVQVPVSFFSSGAVPDAVLIDAAAVVVFDVERAVVDGAVQEQGETVGLLSFVAFVTAFVFGEQGVVGGFVP